MDKNWIESLRTELRKRAAAHDIGEVSNVDVAAITRGFESMAFIEQAVEVVKIRDLLSELVALATQAEARKIAKKHFFAYHGLRGAVSPEAAARLAGRAAREAQLDRNACPTWEDRPDMAGAWLRGWDEAGL